jgi:hypothetical protein
MAPQGRLYLINLHAQLCCSHGGRCITQYSDLALQRRELCAQWPIGARSTSLQMRLLTCALALVSSCPHVEHALSALVVCLEEAWSGK